jgi:hypothetical protein
MASSWDHGQPTADVQRDVSAGSVALREILDTSGLTLPVGIARPVSALSGFALVLAGLLVYDGLAKREAVSRRPGGFP